MKLGNKSDHLRLLKNVIFQLHGVRARHIGSEPVIVHSHGETIWEGVVEVFNLRDHPDANRAYAWVNETGDNDRLKGYLTALHIPPIVSAQTAVRSSITRTLRSGEQNGQRNVLGGAQPSR